MIPTINMAMVTRDARWTNSTGLDSSSLMLMIAPVANKANTGRMEMAAITRMLVGTVKDGSSSKNRIPVMITPANAANL